MKVKTFEQFVNEYDTEEIDEYNYGKLLDHIRELAREHGKRVLHVEGDFGVGFDTRVASSKESRHGGLNIATEFYNGNIMLDVMTHRTVYSENDIDLETAKRNLTDLFNKFLY